MGEARGVTRLKTATGAVFAHIAEARAKTERELDERRERFASMDVDAGATVVLMGSWGRRELTSESDDDFMVLFEGQRRDDARPTVDQVAALLDGPAPGPEDIFGQQVWLEDLREKIGRDEDSNANLTRRMLFILESVAVCGQEVCARSR